MIRPATPDDTPAIVELGVTTGMFPADDVGALREVLDGFHAGQSAPDHRLEVWVDDAEGVPVGVVYFGPDPMADRKWDLWMIAVAPDRQGLGMGSELIKFTESVVRAAGGRLLLIDTSSQPKYDGSRAFYAGHGYVEVARIPDFYTDGDGKVVYSKRISRLEI